MSARATPSYDWADLRRSSSTTALMMARQEVQRKKRLENVKSTVGSKLVTKGRKKKRPGVLKSIPKSNSTGRIPQKPFTLRFNDTCTIKDRPAKSSNQDEGQDDSLKSKQRAKASRKIKKKSTTRCASAAPTVSERIETSHHPIRSAERPTRGEQAACENALDLFDADFTALDLTTTEPPPAAGGEEESRALEPQDSNREENHAPGHEQDPADVGDNNCPDEDARSESKSEILTAAEARPNKSTRTTDVKSNFAEKRRLMTSRERRDEKKGAWTLADLKQEHRAALELLREIETDRIV